jgi:glycosyltransferase involved in cell wall biosynthesis
VSNVSIVLLTYNRLKYAGITLRSALDYIKTTHPLYVHIASDGDSDEYIDYLQDIAGGYAHVKGVSSTNSQRGGYGKNFNLMTQSVHQHSKYVLPLEDDWKLTRPLDIDPLIDVLDLDAGIECIRLGYLGYTQELRGHVERLNNQMFLILDPYSDEPHVFSGHPRLETRDYEKRVGLWPEGLLPGETEFFVATEIFESRRKVAWPMDLVQPRGDLFVHVGTDRSY